MTKTTDPPETKSPGQALPRKAKALAALQQIKLVCDAFAQAGERSGAAICVQIITDIVHRELGDF